MQSTRPFAPARINNYLYYSCPKREALRNGFIIVIVTNDVDDGDKEHNVRKENLTRAYVFLSLSL